MEGRKDEQVFIRPYLQNPRWDGDRVVREACRLAGLAVRENGVQGKLKQAAWRSPGSASWEEAVMNWTMTSPYYLEASRE